MTEREYSLDQKYDSSENKKLDENNQFWKETCDDYDSIDYEPDDEIYNDNSYILLMIVKELKDIKNILKNKQ